MKWFFSKENTFFYIFLPSTPPYWQIILRFVDNGHLRGCKRESKSRDIFRLSVVLGFDHCLTKYILEVHILAPYNLNFELLVFSIYIWYNPRTTERRKMSRDLLSLLQPRRCSLSTKSEDYLSQLNHLISLITSKLKRKSKTIIVFSFYWINENIWCRTSNI